MKKKLLKILIYVSIFSMLLTLCSGFASAVDPVSAATMANALAQAITAYGASQGVSMTFDVTSTDGIGEGVHELWDNFKEDIQDNNVPTYDSLAVTMWADIYTKVGNNIGININDTEMPYIDAFWNWLLSGPAEMSKVDNQYYEWTVDQQGTINPINVITISGSPFYGQPYTSFTTSMVLLNNTTKTVSITSNNNVIFAIKYESNPNLGTLYAYSTSNTSVATWYSPDGSRTYYPRDSIVVDGTTYYYDISTGNPGGYNGIIQGLPTYQRTSNETINDYLSKVIRACWGTNYPTDNLSVKPYVGDVPQDVYIPDNEDVNYSPLPYVGGIDRPWDNSLFGDGTDTLTDAQKEAIADTLDNAITENPDKTLELADDSPLPAPPSEVYIPFLPLQLPSFNFSLSGIWHYVVTWVGTLGSWFTAMFNMWSCLPYAMVVPVYATLVVVIVLGVYRRFLS